MTTALPTATLPLADTPVANATATASPVAPTTEKTPESSLPPAMQNAVADILHMEYPNIELLFQTFLQLQNGPLLRSDKSEGPKKDEKEDLRTDTIKSLIKGLMGTGKPEDLKKDAVPQDPKKDEKDVKEPKKEIKLQDVNPDIMDTLKSLVCLFGQCGGMLKSNLEDSQSEEDEKMAIKRAKFSAEVKKALEEGDDDNRPYKFVKVQHVSCPASEDNVQAALAGKDQLILGQQALVRLYKKRLEMANEKLNAANTRLEAAVKRERMLLHEIQKRDRRIETWKQYATYLYSQVRAQFETQFPCPLDSPFAPCRLCRKSPCVNERHGGC